MKQYAQIFFPLALLFAAMLAGCTRQTALAPPEIHYGFDTCTECGMIVTDSHYGAALFWCNSPNGPAETAVFDDIGCLLNWKHHHPNAQIMRAWVKNVRTGDWLNATSALYVDSSHLHTPMGSGIAAGAVTSDFSCLPVQQPVLAWTDLLSDKRSEADGETSAGPGRHND